MMIIPLGRHCFEPSVLRMSPEDGRLELRQPEACLAGVIERQVGGGLTVAQGFR